VQLVYDSEAEEHFHGLIYCSSDMLANGLTAILLDTLQIFAVVMAYASEKLLGPSFDGAPIMCE